MADSYLRNTLILVAQRLSEREEYYELDAFHAYHNGMADLIATITTPLGVDVDYAREEILAEIRKEGKP